jgi:ElaB/YqjD/DUF883 family membrane-anchored ribosome-binding protein
MVWEVKNMAEAIKKTGEKVARHAARDVERELELRTAPLKHELDEAGKALAGVYDQAKHTLSTETEHLQEGIEGLANNLSDVIRDQPWLGAMIAAGSSLIAGSMFLIGRERRRREQHWRRRAQRMAQQAQQTARREIDYAQGRAGELGERVGETFESHRTAMMGTAAATLALVGLLTMLLNKKSSNGNGS